MNLVRKLNPRSSSRSGRVECASNAEDSVPGPEFVDGTSGGESSKSPPPSTTSCEEGRARSSPDRTLPLLQLRKAYAEYTKVAGHSGSKEHESKMKVMLPIFAKVITMYDPTDLPGVFKELTPFTGHICRHLVQEIRKRAANHSTEQAARTIADFLCPSALEEANLAAAWDNITTFDSASGANDRNNSGWLLLYGVNELLQCNLLSTVEAACKAALPSTMAKALYLFYDLPASSQPNSGRVESLHQAGPDTDQTRLPVDLTDRWQTKFIELLSRLCSHSCSGEELVRKDDLSLLFSGASTWCPPQNIRWRKATAELLMIITTRILTQTVIKYIHSKGCIGVYLDNLRHADDGCALSIGDVVEMIVCLFCILKDSSHVTPVLLNDFKTADGYEYLTFFITQHSNETSVESIEAVRSLLLMFSTAVMAGTQDLKASMSANLYTLPGFQLPNPMGHGCSVRNVHAFAILEHCFIQCPQDEVCSTVLDVIQSIYNADPANYFILEQQCTLGKFAEVIHTKNKAVQTKFFELLEFVVFHLNYVPCKEFIALSVMLKSHTNVPCYTLCVQSCFRVLTFSPIFRDVFREVGLLETLIWLLAQWVDVARTKGIEQLASQEQQLCLLLIDIIAMTVKGNNANAKIYSECSGGQLLLELVSDERMSAWRACLLRLVQQLLMLTGGEDHLSALLTLLHTMEHSHTALKMDVLKSLLCVVRESHRVRVAFRKCGGYLCLMSLLLSLEGALSEPPSAQWSQVTLECGLNVLAIEVMQAVFKLLTISMRFEPSNAKFFQSEVRYDSVSISLRLTGAFSEQDVIQISDSEPKELDMKDAVVLNCFRACQQVFDTGIEEQTTLGTMPSQAVYILCAVRYLYNVALDAFDKSLNTVQLNDKSAQMDTNPTGVFPMATDTIIVHPRAVCCILELLPGIELIDPMWQQCLRVYVCEVIKSMLRTERNQQVMCDSALPRRMFSVCRHLLRVDQHPLLQPVMYVLERLSAQAMQPRELRDFLRLDLPLCCRALDTHNPYVRECKEDDNAQHDDYDYSCNVHDTQPQLPDEGGSVPLARVKTLVSMMTPRDQRVQTPAFVEFDMSVEGFGCVLLPSIAPQQHAQQTHIYGSMTGVLSGSVALLTNAGTGQSLDADAQGGVGSGERVFPPVNGLSLSTWVNVQRFSDVQDAHPIRLLTITRSVPTARALPGSEKASRRSSTLTDWFAVAGELTASRVLQQSPNTAHSQCSSTNGIQSGAQIDNQQSMELSCLTVQISPADRTLLICTFESDCPGMDLEQDKPPSDFLCRVQVPELEDTQQWIHLVVVLSKTMLKHSTVTVYVNGQQSCQQRLQYVSANTTSGNEPPSVHASIGTPPGPLRKQSKLMWRMASTHLIDDVLSVEQVQCIRDLGPAYTGCFQSPQLRGAGPAAVFLAEEKISVGLHAHALSQMTVARLRKLYNKTDSRAIARYLGVSVNENATPIRVLHNAAGHLQGPAHSLGGVLIGYLGIRTFCPHAVPKLLEAVGGVSALLGLVAMVNDSEGLYASLKALLCALNNNDNMHAQMDAIRGYQTLGFHLKEKSHLLNSHILHLVFALIGTLDSTRETTVIPNVGAFEDLLCDLLIWQNAPVELHRLLYEHFYELITESHSHSENLTVIRETALLPRLLFRTCGEHELLRGVKDIVFNLFAAILQPVADDDGLLRFGQFIASTIPIDGSSTAEKNIPLSWQQMEPLLFEEPTTGAELSAEQSVVYQIYVRNRCLNILLNSLTHISGTLNAAYCEQIVQVLGFDWLMALMSALVHDGTVHLALRLLVLLLAHPQLLLRFRDGAAPNGGWLSDVDAVVQNRAGVLLGFSVSAHGGPVAPSVDINRDLCACPGFTALAHVLPNHAHLSTSYLALLAILVGRCHANKRVCMDKPLVGENALSLDSVWTLVFGLPRNSSVAEAIADAQLCVQAVGPLLALVRHCVHVSLPSVLTTAEHQSHWSRSNAQCVLQFLTFMYHNVADFALYCATEHFLVNLVNVMFEENDAQMNSLRKDDKSDQNIAIGDAATGDSASCSEDITVKCFAEEEHPSCKAVIELLKNILVDAFHTGLPAKGEAPIDFILDLAVSEQGSKSQQCAFVTTLCNVCMEHLLASDVLIFGQSASQPMSQSVSAQTYSTLAANVFYFTSRLVDNVWNGLYTDSSMVAFDFCVKLLGQVKRKNSNSNLNVDSLLHSMNRVVLHLLSRPIQGTTAQLSMVESLHKVVTHRLLVLGPANQDAHFHACLAHLLFMLSVRPDYTASPDEAPAQTDMQAASEASRFNEGSSLIASAATRVWKELIAAKKQTLEDRLKVTLVAELNAARSVAGDAASHQWQAFVDAEIRGTNRDTAQIHTQLQSKIQKVASGLQRLTSRTSSKTSMAGVSSGLSFMSSSTSVTTNGSQGRSAANALTANINKHDVELWLRVHTSLVRELVRVQCAHYTQWHEHVHKYCNDQWHTVEQELTRERGLWGPEWGSRLDKYVLDTTEGPNRIRIKLVPNDSFYIQYPYRPALDLPENRSMRNKIAVSRDSQSYYELVLARRPRTYDRRIFDGSAAVAKHSEEDKAFVIRDLHEVNTSMIRRVSITPANQQQASTDDASTSLQDSDEGDKQTDKEDESSLANNDLLETILQDEEQIMLEDSHSINDEISAHESDSVSMSSAKIDANGQKAAPNTETLHDGDSKPESMIRTEADTNNGNGNAALVPASPQRAPDNQTLLRLLEQGEELQSMFRCARVNGLESIESLLLFGREHYYVVDGYTLLKTREIRDLDFLSEDLHDPIVPYTAMGTTRPTGCRRLCSKFPYELIREVHKRRFLLQPIALELFSSDGRNHLLAFPKKMRNRVHAKFVSVAGTLTDGGQSVSGQRQGVSVEHSGRLAVLSSLMGDTSVTERWLKGDTSNFQYLMQLNTLAGRSYNDLSQYPVFPWIIADYDSEELDLTNPATFRDLSKPIGALDDNRLQQFLKRFREWDDPMGETPPYMYGTHYSAMIVVSYMVRMEPFSQQFLKLQGGHFDLADRMFHSIKDAWMSASKNNMADVKELVPEFFYLPQFLCNTNHFDLGVKQNGNALEDVQLPPWAKGCPHEFIRKHREALECDYVSAHLHEWIDLIFGHKQKGDAAVQACNLFHHLFYEGNVDFDMIEDPLMRNATIGFINNFGQIPTQLFKKPHPQQRIQPGAQLSRSLSVSANNQNTNNLLSALTDSLQPTPGVTTDRLFYHALDALKPPAQPIRQLRGAVGELVQNEKGVLCACEQNQVLQPPSLQRYVAWGYADRSIRLALCESDKSVCIHEQSEYGEIVSVVCPNNRLLISANTNTVVHVWELVGAPGRVLQGCQLRLCKALYGHTESVSCLAASGAFGVLVSGSRDATCIIWDLFSLSLIRQLGPHTAPVSALAINEATGDIASASGSHLFVWTLNGEPLASVNTCPSLNIRQQSIVLTIAFSTLNEWDPMHVVMTGGNDGVVRFWSLAYVQVQKDGRAKVAQQPAQGLDTNSGMASPSGIAGCAKGGPLTPEMLHERLRARKALKSTSSTLSLDTTGYTDVCSPPDHFTGTDAHTPSQAPKSAGLRAEEDREFVFVNEQGMVDANQLTGRGSLVSGFVWQRQLVFRYKLTMHTAMERRDNNAPAPITAIAPARDHKSLFIGDARGRVWQWLVGEGQPTGRQDHWVQDPARHTCTQCQQKFSMAERRHHCRNCGRIFCAKCSRFESEIRHMKISKPVRVCQSCFLRLKAETA